MGLKKQKNDCRDGPISPEKDKSFDEYFDLSISNGIPIYLNEVYNVWRPLSTRDKLHIVQLLSEIRNVEVNNSIFIILMTIMNPKIKGVEDLEARVKKIIPLVKQDTSVDNVFDDIINLIKNIYGLINSKADRVGDTNMGLPSVLAIPAFSIFNWGTKNSEKLNDFPISLNESSNNRRATIPSVIKLLENNTNPKAPWCELSNNPTTLSIQSNENDDDEEKNTYEWVSIGSETSYLIALCTLENLEVYFDGEIKNVYDKKSLGTLFTLTMMKQIDQPIYVNILLRILLPWYMYKEKTNYDDRLNSKLWWTYISGALIDYGMFKSDGGSFDMMLIFLSWVLFYELGSNWQSKSRCAKIVNVLKMLIQVLDAEYLLENPASVYQRANGIKDKIPYFSLIFLVYNFIKSNIIDENSPLTNKDNLKMLGDVSDNINKMIRFTKKYNPFTNSSDVCNSLLIL